MILRRSHLYFGLLLMPWALLYGVTGYLFNHPTHFSEDSNRAFGRQVLSGTALEHFPDPNVVAQQVVDELNKRFNREVPLSLDRNEPAKFDGDFVIATMDQSIGSHAKTIHLQIYRNGAGGLVRIQDRGTGNSLGETASFTVTPRSADGRADGRAGGIGVNTNADANAIPLRISDGILEASKASLATIASRLAIEGKPSDFKLTSAPELVFHVVEGEKKWIARYRSIAGAVSAKLATSVAETPIAWRRFLTRMHVAHGYPMEKNARWFWAIIVDVMAFVMIFWGISGIVMWWQIKRTRPWGTVALAVSVLFAALLGSGMLQMIR